MAGLGEKADRPVLADHGPPQLISLPAIRIVANQLFNTN
jgi:hypothetical protein